MNAQSFKSRLEALDYFSTTPPLLESDFILQIKNDTNSTPVSIPIISYNFPAIGLDYSPSEDYGHATPKLSANNIIEIKYVVRVNATDPFNAFLYSQYHMFQGVPLFVPKTNLPDISINKQSTFSGSNVVSSETLDPVVSLYSCRFSTPKVGINIASLNAAVHTITAAFEDYIIY